MYCMMDQTMEVIQEEVELKLPDLPKTLSKNIEPITKAGKEEKIEKQISRFRTK